MIENHDTTYHQKDLIMIFIIICKDLYITVVIQSL